MPNSHLLLLPYLPLQCSFNKSENANNVPPHMLTSYYPIHAV